MANALAWVNAAYPPFVASVGVGSPSSNLNMNNIPVASGVVSGSLVLVYVWKYYAGSTLPTSANITPDTGFNLGPSLAYADSSNGGVVWAAWYYKFATGADSGNYSFSYTAPSGDSNSAAGGGFSARIVGATATSGNPFVDTAQSASVSTATTSVTVSAFTPGANNSLLLAGISWTSLGGNGTITGSPAGWTVPVNSQTFSGDNIEFAWLQQGTAASTGSLTWNATNVNGASAIIVTIR